MRRQKLAINLYTIQETLNEHDKRIISQYNNSEGKIGGRVVGFIDPIYKWGCGGNC